MVINKIQTSTFHFPFMACDHIQTKAESRCANNTPRSLLSISTLDYHYVSYQDIWSVLGSTHSWMFPLYSRVSWSWVRAAGSLTVKPQEREVQACRGARRPEFYSRFVQPIASLFRFHSYTLLCNDPLSDVTDLMYFFFSLYIRRPMKVAF